MVTSGDVPPMIGCLITPVALIGVSNMEVTEDILLPVLLAAIIVNTMIMLAVVAARFGRRERVGPAATRTALHGSLLSTSYADQSARSTWPSEREANGTAPIGSESDVGEDSEAAEAPEAAADRGFEDPRDRWNDIDEEPTADTALDAAGLAPDNDPADQTDLAGETDPADDMTGEDPAGIEPDPRRDTLTGLIDPAAFSRLVAAEDLRIQRYGRPATVVIFELGGLDRLIDRLGADAADRVVAALADTMRRLARDVDHVARLAPGRFGALLPETDEIAAINYVERVRRACELWLESGAIALSLAVGWAGTTGDPTLIEAHRLASERMYVELRRHRRATDR